MNSIETNREEIGRNEIRPSAEGATQPADNRIISGIDLVDHGGGLLGEHAYLVKGGTGLGKSIVGLQFLARGLELQEPGVLVTSQKPSHVLEQARSIGFTLDEPVKRGQLMILNPTTRYFELVESPADVMAIVEELADYIRNTGARRLVIDPVFALINTSYSSHFAVTVAQSLLNALEELPVTTMLIASDDSNPERTPVVRAFEENCAGVISLSHDATTNGRRMQLTKFRFGSSDDTSSHYRILNGRGVINYRGEGEQVTDVTKPWEEPQNVSRSVFLLGANTETIRKVREALGDEYKVTAESDLRTGIDRVRSEKPGLVLVTPTRSVQSVNTIFDLTRDSNAAIAFLSPSANRSSDKFFYLRAGADDFITEPFAPAELRARVDALIRRSGRRLTPQGAASISADEMNALASQVEARTTKKASSVLRKTNGRLEFEPQFREKLLRNIDTVSKLDLNFALYCLKTDDHAINKRIAELSRHEDVICRNARGEFVALLTNTDENGVKGFETRLREKLGSAFEKSEHGYAIYTSGQSIDDLTSKALAMSA